MGMFDNIKCSYPLPIEGLENEVFQTKDTPAQFLDTYEIREDGTLWHEEYDIEDKSDRSKKGIERMFGCMSRVNERWEQVTNFTGEIRFYTSIDTRWIDFSAYFVNGKLNQLHIIKDGEI